MEEHMTFNHGVGSSSLPRHTIIRRINPKGKGTVLKTVSSGASRVWFRDPHPPPDARAIRSGSYSLIEGPTEVRYSY